MKKYIVKPEEIYNAIDMLDSNFDISKYFKIQWSDVEPGVQEENLISFIICYPELLNSISGVPSDIGIKIIRRRGGYIYKHNTEFYNVMINYDWTGDRFSVIEELIKAEPLAIILVNRNHQLSAEELKELQNIALKDDFVSTIASGHEITIDIEDLDKRMSNMKYPERDGYLRRYFNRLEFCKVINEDVAMDLVKHNINFVFCLPTKYDSVCEYAINNGCINAFYVASDNVKQRFFQQAFDKDPMICIECLGVEEALKHVDNPGEVLMECFKKHPHTIQKLLEGPRD